MAAFCFGLRSPFFEIALVLVRLITIAISENAQHMFETAAVAIIVMIARKQIDHKVHSKHIEPDDLRCACFFNAELNGA